jgi:hypothetical protein
MMSKSPDKRYQSYDELIEHLRFALSKANDALTNPVAARTSQLTRPTDLRLPFNAQSTVCGRAFFLAVKIFCASVRKMFQ